jgi:hypothetical protein
MDGSITISFLKHQKYQLTNSLQYLQCLQLCKQKILIFTFCSSFESAILILWLNHKNHSVVTLAGLSPPNGRASAMPAVNGTP